MLYRPYGVVLDGCLELGLEVEVYEGRVASVRPHSRKPEEYVLSPAFVNAHSHLEYRGLQGGIPASDYWSWIRALTLAKGAQSLEQVRLDCLLAAEEHRRTGVALIGEHSDRPFAGAALAREGISGTIFQEIITFFEHETREEKLAAVLARADENRENFSGLVTPSPHAYYTVDRQTLAEIGASGRPFSIHVAETPFESEFTVSGGGPIGDFHRAHNIPFEVTGKSVVESLKDLGLARAGAQFVHCCAMEEGEPELLASSGVAIAHCPRSNAALGCPPAPIRELLDAGAVVGLGLDSAASSGAIDFFAEMGAAVRASLSRAAPLSGEEVWRMATGMGAQCIPGFDAGPWEIVVGSAVPMIAIEVAGARSVLDLIDKGTPDRIRWIPA